MKKLVLIGLLLSFQLNYASCQARDSAQAIKIFRNIGYAGAAMATAGVVMSGYAVNELISNPYENHEARGYLVDGLFLIGVGGAIGIKSLIMLGRVKEAEGDGRNYISTKNLASSEKV
ncbi:MAG: hypothetical protein Q8Q60_02675 [Candidatus Chromulinivorax sp.]|nr:hypothetical protein [Candidatus Chromulinivorax sp.]